MKQLIIFIAAILSYLAGFAQGGYDPENPGDPNPYRSLSVTASPKAGGSANTYSKSQMAVGQSVTCYANANEYYEFVHWLKNGEIATTESRFEFTMPDEDVEMVAVFELNYNPASPGDPQEAKPTHRVTLTANPGKGGRFNNSSFKLEEGDSTNIYAYPNEGYRFEEWLLDGVLVSTKNPLKVKMTDKDLNFTARFSYNPYSPADPAENLFNPATGQMVIDRFEAGRLSDAIYQKLGDTYGYADVQSLLVNGLMDSYDVGCVGNLTNCVKIDLSRTNGYGEIPSYAFEEMTALTEVSLPACIESIDYYAFVGCNNLSVISCYSPIPPALGYGVFQGVDDALVIKVPLQSVMIYSEAEGWKDFTILPLDSDVYSIAVKLPEDSADGRYKNMSIELLNTNNGQRYKYLITDKTEYTFGNLLSGTKYSVCVKNAKNEILGEITDLEIVDKDVTTAFQSLKQPMNISVKVLAPNGADITNDVTVKWFNEANELLQQGPAIAGVLENTVVAYTISLPQQLQGVYVQPKSETIKVSEQKELIYELEEIGFCSLSGKVCDENGKEITSATIAISQCINGVYCNSVITNCDNEGNYSIEIPNVAIKAVISANGYVAQTKELQSASEGIGDVALAKNTGITVYPSYAMQTSAVPGEEQQNGGWYSDDSNIAYRIEDANGNELANCIYQSGSIILPEDMELGDEIRVVAYSKTGKFADACKSVALNAKSVYVDLQIVEYGGINVTVDGDAVNSSLCLLYDSEGKQVGKASFRDNSASFANLPDGEYSIVAMRKSTLMSSVTNLSSLQETQLAQGQDYLLNNASAVSGKIAEVALSTIPELDETKLYYTNSKETYFMPNKAELTIGNYLTLKAKLTMKDEYADAIDAATLVVDIPANCELVENSIISGTGYMGYEYANNRLSIPIQKLSDAVRFCIVPLEGGECKPTAFVKLVIDNNEVLQPIGSAYFQAKNFSLVAPQKTGKTSIAIRGTASADSEVKIYDNDVLVGSTYSMPNGEWATNISFVKPYTHSLHEVYAEVIDQDGHRLLTNTKMIDYNQSYSDLSTITMVYGKNKFVFDQQKGRVSDANYIYWVHPDGDGYQPEPKFTFVADFTSNNPEVISNVIFRVKTLDGSIRKLPADYNESTGNWVATSRFSERQAPTNVTADYLLQIGSVDNSESFEEQTQILSSCAVEINNYVLNNWNYIIVEESQDKIVFDIIDQNAEQYSINIKNIDFDEACNLMNSVQFDFLKTDGGQYLCSHTTIYDGQIIVTFVDLEDSLSYEVSFIFDNKGPKFARGLSGRILSGFSWAGNNLGNLLSNIIPYFTIQSDLDCMYKYAKKYNWDLDELWKNTEDYLKVRCSDGTLRLTDREIVEFYREMSFLKENENAFIDDMYNYISEYKRKVEYSIAYDIALTVLGGKAASLIAKSLKFMPNSKFISSSTKFFTAGTSNKQISNILTNSLGVCLNGIISGADKIFNPAFADFQGTYEKFSEWAPKQFYNFTDKHIRLQEDIKLNYKDCPEDEDEDDGDDENDDEEEDDDDFPTPPLTPSIDPSGYVYEAVPSNRIAGVTATAYFNQQSEDMYGEITETALVWDATPFNQENPLTTDAQGMYAWDVPAGMWQVRFEKEGYEPAQSAWLPVPPPQLDVNIAMTQSKQPEVKAVHAYSDGVVIEFDKFMMPSTLTIGNIIVSQNDKMVAGEIEAVDMELDANGNAFCSKVEFKPASALAEGEATLFVSKSAKSYANIGMGEDFTQSFTVEPRISEIKVDDNIEVNSGSSIRMTVEILPASASAGKTVVIESFNSIIAEVSAEKALVDENGIVTFDVTGLVIGSTSVKISVEGYDTEKIVKVTVTVPRDEQQVVTPYASEESGTLQSGTEIYLYCDTENAVIYYTIDGSCPCGSDRIKYDGTPIIATKDFTLKIMAEAEGMIESEVAEYEYIVTTSSISDVALDKDLSIYPLPLGETLNISNGGALIESVSIFDLSGKRMSYSNRQEKTVTLKVGFLQSGVYLLNIETNGKTITTKVTKR